MELKRLVAMKQSGGNMDEDSIEYELTATPTNSMRGGNFLNYISNNHTGEEPEMGEPDMGEPEMEEPEMEDEEDMVLTTTPMMEGIMTGGWSLDNVSAYVSSGNVSAPSISGCTNANVNPQPTMSPVAATQVQPSTNVVVPPATTNVMTQPTGEVVAQTAADVSVMPTANSKNMVNMNSDEELSEIENTTDIEKIFKQLGGKRNTNDEEDIFSDNEENIFSEDDSEDIFSDEEDIDSFSDASLTPSSTNPFA
jgi:hypothetical protein